MPIPNLTSKYPAYQRETFGVSLFGVDEMGRRSKHTEDIHICMTPELRQAIERESKRLRVRPSTFIRMTLARRCAAEETLAEKEQGDADQDL